MNQTNTVTSGEIAIRVLTFCLLLIGGVWVLATQTETQVTSCPQIETPEPEPELESKQ